MKVKRTYLQGCTWCNATGQKIPMQYTGTGFSSICPVCNGSKTVLVTEEYDALYEIDCSKVDVLIPIIENGKNKNK